MMKPTQTEITRTEECLHTEFSDGKVTFGIYMSTEVGDTELENAVLKWAECEDVFINFRFSVRDCVEDMIEGRRLLHADSLVMEADDKPMVDALRAELTEMIGLLQTIRFESVGAITSKEG